MAGPVGATAYAIDLWRRIEAFSVDVGDEQLTFVARLARENDWSVPFAQRVYGEYKRFLFLACAAGHKVTPSDEVDQAWHLHLVYTESYWDHLCQNVLQRPLHHGPTKGGASEGAKFENWYARTLDTYQRAFGESAPRDIWPPADVRFGLAPHFKRINVKDRFILSRTSVSTVAGIGVMALALVAVACSARPTPSSLSVPVVAALGVDAWVMIGMVLVVVALGVLLVIARAGGHRNGAATGSGGCSTFLGFGDAGSSHTHSGGHSGHHGSSHHGHSDSGSSGHGGDSGGGTSGCGTSGCGSSGCGGGGCGSS